MKYRILIQKIINANQATLQWYMETGNTPWETDDKSVVLAKYKELLQKYSAGDLILVNPVDVDIAISA